MYPFPYTGLRLLHDEKVRDAMERARIDAELARNSRRTVQLSLLRSVFMRIRSGLNIFARVEHLRRGSRALAIKDPRVTAVNRAATCCSQAPSRDGVSQDWGECCIKNV